MRLSHRLIDGGLCRCDDSAVYSQDGGKTWIPRPGGAVNLHQGMDYQCRCTAIAYWQELVDEADGMIAEKEVYLAVPDIGGQKPTHNELAHNPGKDILSAGVKTALADILNKGKADGLEHMNIMTQNGDVLGTQKGEKNKILFSSSSKTLLENLAENSVTLAHTHPTGQSFSGEDLKTMCDFPAIKELRVVGHNGRTYYMSIGNGQRPDGDVVLKKYNDILTEKVFESIGKNGADTLITETNMELAKKCGWTYREGILDGE